VYVFELEAMQAAQRFDRMKKKLKLFERKIVSLQKKINEYGKYDI